jgi:transposase
MASVAIDTCALRTQEAPQSTTVTPDRLVERDRQTLRCAGCGARPGALTRDGTFTRVFRALPLGRRPQFIVLHKRRRACSNCHRTPREPIPFADGKRRYTKGLSGATSQSCAA